MPSAPNARTDDSTRTWALDFNVKVLTLVRWRRGQRLQTPPELQMALICVNPETLTTDDAQAYLVSDGDDRIVKDAERAIPSATSCELLRTRWAALL
jgi:hypothetical protein